VPQQTHEAINRQIRGETERRIACYRHRGSRAIRRRLAELDREWDIERTLESNAAVVSLIGLVLGRFVDRRWYLLPGFVAAFLIQHATCRAGLVSASADLPPHGRPNGTEDRP
jgi:hypothetical protein